MRYFVKFMGRAWKYLQSGAQMKYSALMPAHCSIWKKTPRVWIPLQSIHIHRNHEDRRQMGNEGYYFWLPAGGLFLSILNWGEEKEEEKVPELIMSIKRSIWLIQKEEYQKAEQLLHVALRQAQALQHYEGITYVYDVMANLAFEIEDYRKAEVLFVSVMQRLIAKGTPKDDIKIIHISLKMAKLFQQMGDVGKAEEGYEFCLKSLEDHMQKDPDNEDIIVLWAMSLDWYARMLLTQSKYAHALRNIEQAYHLCLRVHGREHEQTVILLNDLGTISCLNGEPDRAIDYLMHAAEIGEKLPEMKELGSIHVNLGSVYLKKGLYDEAKKSCEEGRKIAILKKNTECIEEAKNCLDENNFIVCMGIAVSLVNLGDFFD